jgi:hypothetical protein
MPLGPRMRPQKVPGMSSAARSSCRVHAHFLCRERLLHASAPKRSRQLLDVHVVGVGQGCVARRCVSQAAMRLNQQGGCVGLVGFRVQA